LDTACPLLSGPQVYNLKDKGQLRSNVDQKLRQTEWRIEVGQQPFPEFIGLQQKSCILIQGVRREKTTQITNCRFEEGYCFVLMFKILEVFCFALQGTNIVECQIPDMGCCSLYMLIQAHQDHGIEGIYGRYSPPVVAVMDVNQLELAHANET
jgi:hypothetical protein